MAETTIPFFLGDPIEKAYSKIGEPDRTRNFDGQTIASFARYGVCVTSNDFEIVEINASWFEIDEKEGKFDGKIHGIALGDSIDLHSPRLGAPRSRQDDSSSADLTWGIDGHFLVVEIQTEGGDEDHWGRYEAGFISRITVKRTQMTDEETHDAAAKMIQEIYPSIPLDKIKQGLAEMESDSRGG